MSRPPGLLAYLSLAALGAPAARRRIAGEIARGGGEATRLAERLGQPSLRRPDGPLVWLHCSSPGQEAALADLARRIGEAEPRTSLLLTSDAPLSLPRPLPPRTVHQLVPHEAGGPVAAFLDHWRPSIGLWAGTTLRPALIHAAAEHGTRLILIDAASAPDALRSWRGWSGLARATLRVFSQILATDIPAGEALINAGARRISVEVAGPLEEEAQTPRCSLSERDAIGAILKARPVWLAVAVPEAEEVAVIAAHLAAARLAHRLLLIIVPSDLARGPELARRIAADGLSVALRSVEGEPDATTEVFVADGEGEGELGLWYRLAPVTYMGGTLGKEGGGRSPLEPAALGSAILHGPALGAHASTFGRFASANAARAIRNPAELGDALSELLSPDRAATLAHAAWRVSTGGADVNERVLSLVARSLAEPAAK